MLRIQSNLGDSNADFSKPPDFSNLTVSPDLFLLSFNVKILPIFRISIIRKIQFFE